MSECEVFITHAQATLPDGTIHNLGNEEAKELLTGSGMKKLLSEQGAIDVTISWIEGTPGQILNVLCGYPIFEDKPKDAFKEG